jgi:hypothetical protein
LLVNFWLTPGLASNHVYIPEGGMVITITDPDGTKEVRNMRSEPATGANYFEYVPDKVGTWTIKFEFLGAFFPAGQYYNGAVVTNSSGAPYKYGSAYYTPAHTEAQNLTVQQDFVWSWPPAALPTDYWTRPVSLNNREWWPILGAYPGNGYQGGGPMWDALYPNTNPADSPNRYSFVPWVQAPNSAHIVWTKQSLSIAGLIGGPAGIYGTTSGGGSPSVIYAGRCYQTMTIPINGVPTSCAVCYDLRTGEQIYAIPTAAPTNGTTPSYIAYIMPIADVSTIAGQEIGSSTWSVELLSISGSRLIKINPSTGAISLNVSISPLSGGLYTNQMSGYVLSLQTINATTGNYRLINWTTRGTSTTLASRIQSNITWPFRAIPNQYTGGTGVNQHGDGILCTDFNAGISAWVTRDTTVGPEIVWGTNVTACYLATGQMLDWKVVLPDEGQYSGSAMLADHGKVAWVSQHGFILAYDLFTGKLAWQSPKMEYPWGASGFGAYAIQSAYGLIYRESYDGVYAFDWDTGKIVWKYAAPTYASYETPYIENGIEVYSFNSGGIVADGKLYTANSEHTPTWPLARGWGIHCINATSGEGIWTLNNPISPGAVADGYLVASNGWDGSTYCFGKGKTATTVTAPDVNVPLGPGFTIKGTVMDMSPAQPNTPCVSKDSMQTQMEYLHLQMPIDGLWHNKTISGVPVTLTAIDANGTVTDLGTVTSNGYYGAFSKSWAPSAEGKYEIIASFASDDSYGSSAASTAVTVGPAPAPNNSQSK